MMRDGWQDGCRDAAHYWCVPSTVVGRWCVCAWLRAREGGGMRVSRLLGGSAQAQYEVYARDGEMKCGPPSCLYWQERSDDAEA